MNENRLYAIPEGNPILLVKEDDFSWNRLDNYSSISKINNYYGAGGDLTIRIYDPFNQQWLVPKGSAVLTPGANKTLDCTLSTTQNGAFVVPDWDGGVLRGGAKSGTKLSIDIIPDTPKRWNGHRSPRSRYPWRAISVIGCFPLFLERRARRRYTT